MKKHLVLLLFLLSFSLILNGVLALSVLDVAVSNTYERVSHLDNTRALKQMQAVVKQFIEQKTSRQEMIGAVNAVTPDIKPFEKEGYTWVFRMGLKFDENGQLLEIKIN